MTNGFDLAKVITTLHSRLGWKQPVASGSPTLTSANTVSKSGRYFNDGSFHSLVTVDNVKATMGEPGVSDTNLNTHLTGLTNAAILRCLNAVFRTKDFIEHTMVLDPLRNQAVRTIPNSGLFVGFEIGIAKATDLALQIDTIQLLFDGAVTLNLYLFAEGKKDPLATISAVDTVNGDTVFKPLDEQLLNYIASTYQSSRFWLGYFQDDLGAVKAIDQQHCLLPTKAFYARPFQSARLGSNNDFNRSQVSYTSYSYGLNLEVSSFKDHTQTIIKNPALFDEVIGLSVAYSVLEQIIYSTQSNATERILKEGMDRVGIQMELTGVAPITDGPPKIKGLNARIEAELERLRKSFYPKPKAQVINLACS